MRDRFQDVLIVCERSFHRAVVFHKDVPRIDKNRRRDVLHARYDESCERKSEASVAHIDESILEDTCNNCQAFLFCYRPQA